MKLKDKYKIGGHWIDVEERSEKEGYFKQGTDCRWFNKIFIQSDLAQSKKESNLLHEVIHEIDGQMDIDLSENQVSILSEGFYQFLVDNDLLKE